MSTFNHLSGDVIIFQDDCTGYSPQSFNLPAHYEEDLECVLIPKGLVIDRTERLAADIFKNVDHTKPLVALCVLKGGYIFFNDLLHQLRQLCAQSNKSCQISIDFIRLKSYEDDQSSGTVKVVGGDDLSRLAGKNVLIVEVNMTHNAQETNKLKEIGKYSSSNSFQDIIDSGRTMEKLLNIIKPYKPDSVAVASMLVKRTVRSSGYRPEYIGFEVPDKFVVGYGLDFNEYFRDLGHLCVMKSSSMNKYKK